VDWIVAADSVLSSAVSRKFIILHTSTSIHLSTGFNDRPRGQLHNHQLGLVKELTREWFTFCIVLYSTVWHFLYYFLTICITFRSAHGKGSKVEQWRSPINWIYPSSKVGDAIYHMDPKKCTRASFSSWLETTWLMSAISSDTLILQSKVSVCVLRCFVFQLNKGKSEIWFEQFHYLILSIYTYRNSP
jgi:hypothetical protein